VRLYGHNAILRHLGYGLKATCTWQAVKRRYADAIKRDAVTGRVWADSDELDAVRLRGDSKALLRHFAGRAERMREAVGKKW
jgi:hypothetical protein